MKNIREKHKRLSQSTLISPEKREATQKRYRIKTIQRQKVIHDGKAGLLYFWLKKGAYLTAGRKYGFNPPAALGVNRSILDYAIRENLTIRVFEKNRFDRAYETDPQPWLELNAVEVRKGTHIYLYPWKLFKTILAKDDPTITIVTKIFERKAESDD